MAQRLGRIDAAGAPARVQRRQQRQQRGQRHDRHDVAGLRIAGHARHQVDAAGQEGDAQRALDRRNDGVDVQRQHQPAGEAGERADQPGRGALDDEDAHHRARRRAQRAQDGDVGALVGHRHHQRGDEVERGHRDDEREDDEHHALFHLHGVEPGAMRARPVAHPVRAAQRGLQLGGHAAGELRFVQPQLHAGGAAAAQQPGRVVQRHQRERAVVLVVARGEGARERELLEPRHDAGGREVAAGHHHRDLVAHGQIERARQFGAQEDAPAPGLQRRDERGLARGLIFYPSYIFWNYSIKYLM